MKEHMILILYKICRWLGIFRLFYSINRNKMLNITYHNVLPDEIFDNSIHLNMSHPASVFERQVVHIAKRFSIRSDDPEKEGGCRITFDDGYVNQKEIAAAILEKHDIRGVFFIPFAPLESGDTLAIDKISKWISYVPGGAYKIAGMELDILNRTRPAVLDMVLRYLRSNADQWYQVVDEMNYAFPYSKLNIEPELERLRFTPLSCGEIEELRNKGHRVGCHGWDHRPLATLAPKVIMEEMVCCFKKVKSYCNCDEFSYPFGGERDVSPAVAIACRQAGFSYGFMNIGMVPPQLKKFRSHALPRISLPITGSTCVLDAKLSGFEGFLKRCLRRVQ